MNESLSMMWKTAAQLGGECAGIVFLGGLARWFYHNCVKFTIDVHGTVRVAPIFLAAVCCVGLALCPVPAVWVWMVRIVGVVAAAHLFLLGTETATLRYIHRFIKELKKPVRQIERSDHADDSDDTDQGVPLSGGSEVGKHRAGFRWW